MNWQQDAATAHAAANFPLPLVSVVPAPQFPGCNFNPASWNKRTLMPTPQNWPKCKPLLSSPTNIVALFQQGAFLEALTMVVSWGGMSRTQKYIYRDHPLALIQQTLQQCSNSIQQTHSIQLAWAALTGEAANQLRWSAVMASKTLHFLSRALGFHQQPPAALDNAVIRDCVWPAFINPIPVAQRPGRWHNDTFAAYSRFMTAVLVWTTQRGWTTTEMEATIFDEYRGK